MIVGPPYHGAKTLRGYSVSWVLHQQQRVLRTVCSKCATHTYRDVSCVLRGFVHASARGVKVLGMLHTRSVYIQRFKIPPEMPSNETYNSRQTGFGVINARKGDGNHSVLYTAAGGIILPVFVKRGSGQVKTSACRSAARTCVWMLLSIVHSYIQHALSRVTPLARPLCCRGCCARSLYPKTSLSPSFNFPDSLIYTSV